MHKLKYLYAYVYDIYIYIYTYIYIYMHMLIAPVENPAPPPFGICLDAPHGIASVGCRTDTGFLTGTITQWTPLWTSLTKKSRTESPRNVEIHLKLRNGLLQPELGR